MKESETDHLGCQHEPERKHENNQIFWFATLVKKHKADVKIPSVQHLQARAFQLLHPHLQQILLQYEFFGGPQEPIYANFVPLLEN